ncbi:Sarcosine/dimethylglycine N-methyltransferase [Symmachiella macrocystis]|uniref:Sarcosine/dimethylglycine N-methyltransferase n=1 Tax=Symmachiella macrocystis TaxID=2527985 RepID=A0A5C6BRU4_9PLAN|nr:class I SAM-dependent methyltransferase [Symmachiella macrocystis]TWU13404.1 Sarcosine/dimethylglycine N-methyltransferase [Symmachiella macrocystis]
MLNRVRNWMRLGRKVAYKAAGRVPGALDPEVVRSMDAEQSGWYIEETGQLCDGFQIKPDDIVVDVGTGTGGMAMFAARQGAEVLATDIDEDAIERVNNMAKGQFEGRLRALVSDSNPLPIPDGFATKVICSEVLEHVPDPAQFLSELARIGQPGAEFLITVPDPVAENIQKSVAPPVYWAPPNHVRIFEREDIQGLVKSVGLDIEHLGRSSFYWSVWWILFWSAKHDLSEPEGPLLKSWSKTWYTLISDPESAHVRDALDQFMPKSQVIVARKAA